VTDEHLFGYVMAGLSTALQSGPCSKSCTLTGGLSQRRPDMIEPDMHGTANDSVKWHLQFKVVG
jgi:hypothetical protein